MTPLALIVATLAAYRVTRMIVMEEGPFSIFSTIRGKLDPNQRGWVGRGVSCVMCVSFWVTLIISVVIGASWIEWLAMAGAIVIWREILSR